MKNGHCLGIVQIRKSLLGGVGGEGGLIDLDNKEGNISIVFCVSLTLGSGQDLLIFTKQFSFHNNTLLANRVFYVEIIQVLFTFCFELIIALCRLLENRAVF